MLGFEFGGKPLHEQGIKISGSKIPIGNMGYDLDLLLCERSNSGSGLAVTEVQNGNIPLSLILEFLPSEESILQRDSRVLVDQFQTIDFSDSTSVENGLSLNS